MSSEPIRSISDVRRGEVVTFNYTSGHDQRPTLLFLNYYNGLIHGLNLHYLSAAQINYLKIILGNELYSIFLVDNPKTFYDNQIKKYHLQVAYRTYKLEKMIRLNRITYKVETIEKDTGISEKPKGYTEELKYNTKPDIKSVIPADFTEQMNKTTIPDNIFGNFWKW